MTDLSRTLDAVDSLGRWAAGPQDRGPKSEVFDNPFIEHKAVYERLNGGDHWEFTFANGWGASVINSPMAYTSSEDQYEVAVIGRDGRLNYTTDITDDVLGHLSVDEVREVLRQIAELS